MGVAVSLTKISTLKSVNINQEIRDRKKPKTKEKMELHLKILS